LSCQHRAGHRQRLLPGRARIHPRIDQRLHAADAEPDAHGLAPAGPAGGRRACGHPRRHPRTGRRTGARGHAVPPGPGPAPAGRSQTGLGPAAERRRTTTSRVRASGAGQRAATRRRQAVQGSSTEVARVRAEQVREQIVRVLAAWGMADDLAATTADLMTETDLLGIDSHGISMLPSYEAKLRAGTLRIDARPRVVRDAVCTALLDGMGGLGYPVAAQAMHLAVDKALAHGVGAVAVQIGRAHV